MKDDSRNQMTWDAR